MKTRECGLPLYAPTVCTSLTIFSGLCTLKYKAWVDDDISTIAASVERCCGLVASI